MKFNKLSVYLDRLEKTSSRIELTKILAELFAEANAEEIDKICYLVLGQLAPGYKGIVFNIAEKMMLRILAKASAEDPEKVLKLYKEKGDLGEVSYILVKQNIVNRKELSVSEVHERLLEVADESGEESQERKVDKMALILRDLDPLSAKFVSRIPVGKLRLGFSDRTILDALSWMETGGKTKKSELEMAFNILPDVGLLAKEVKKKGIDKATREVTPKIGTPILPMLAARLNSTAEMIKKMKRVFVEPKFDGLRIQIHYKKSGFTEAKIKDVTRGNTPKVKAFTRNLNETSWMFPELSGVAGNIKADDVILDTEAVGVDPQRKAMANFQTTMTRRRKHDIDEISKKISIKFNVFDIMYRNGLSLVDKSYEERRKVLASTIKSGEILDVVDYVITEDPQKIADIMQKELKEGMEGIIVKKADSNYIAGRTGWRWVKMKQVEGQNSKLADTVDCVVMGFSAGRGKRVSFGLGQFLVGVKDEEVIKTVTKVGTGLTDEQFRELKKRLSGLVAKEKPKEYVVTKLLEPDFWVEPEVVVEIAADEITKSPNHSSGLALRFPRLIAFRDDKSPEQATTVAEVEKLFKLQKQTDK